MATQKSRRKLQLVIAARHGEYGRDDLNDEGVGQMVKLAEKLRDIISQRHTVTIPSSPLPRATQSAEIISRQFGGSYEVCTELRLDDYADGQKLMGAMMEKRGTANVLVAITHYEAPSGIINAFAQKGFEKGVRRFELPKGNACMVCLKTGKITERVL